MAKEYLLSSVHVHTKLCDGKNTPEELALRGTPPTRSRCGSI